MYEYVKNPKINSLSQDPINCSSHNVLFFLEFQGHLRIPDGFRFLVRVEQREEEEDLGVVQLSGKVHEDVVHVLGSDLLAVAGAPHHLVQPVDQLGMGGYSVMS